MNRITITAPVTVRPEEGGDAITDAAALAALDGRALDDAVMSEHLASDALGDADVGGGSLALRLVDGELHLVTEYVAGRKLTAAQLETLVRFTQAQWAEGEGESLNNALGDERGWFVTPHKARTRAEQTGGAAKRSKLLVAVKKGDLEKVRALVAAGEDLSPRNAKGEGAVDLAVAARDDALAAYLANAGAALPPFIPQPVIASNMPATLDALLARGVDPSAKGGEWHHHPPLYWAANRDKPELAATLIAAGANVDYHCGSYSTLMMAERSPRVFEMLLAAGADITPQDAWGKTVVDRVGFADHPLGVILRRYHPELGPPAE